MIDEEMKEWRTDDERKKTNRNKEANEEVDKGVGGGRERTGQQLERIKR